jgi:nucleoside-diphosphate-sugar epimerase
MRIGITGANGFIGNNLFNYLSDSGFSVTGFTSNKLNNRYRYLNMFDSKEVELALGEIELLIHVAWIGSERENRNNFEIQEKNLIISKNIANLKNLSQIKRIIALGSQDELRDGDQPWSDRSQIVPSSEYGKAKFESYSILGEAFDNFVWARLFSVYGPGDSRDWIINSAVHALKRNIRTTFGLCSKPWSLTYITDVLTALEKIIMGGSSGIINISSLDTHTLKEHLQLLESIADRKIFNFLPNTLPEREISRQIGEIDSLGWIVQYDREKGFRELIK